MKEKIKLPKEIVYLCEKVIPLKDIYSKNKNTLRPAGAVYCFWWIGNRKKLMNSEKRIILLGPGRKDIPLKRQGWFPKDLSYAPLYVGKTTKLKTRISQHLLLKLPGRAHIKPKNFKKVKPKTTSCQLRAGIEYIFPNEEKIIELMLENIGLSFIEEELVSERFYLENFAIGYLKPWFNLDSER